MVTSINKLETYYKNYNRNVGRIKSIQDGIVIANINAGHGGGDVEIPVDHCYKFNPKIDDSFALHE
jgi:hypothetical protein